MEGIVCIFFYAKRSAPIGRKLKKIIMAEGYNDKLKVYNKLENLSLRLHKPKQDLKLIVLLPADRDELLALLLIREKLADIPLILILPDQSKEMTAMGCKLFPRFISYTESDFSDVTGVIRRIIFNRSCLE